MRSSRNCRRDYHRYRRRRWVVGLGLYVALRPRYSTVVVVSGSSYYYCGGVYYVRSGTHYVVVAAPATAVVYAVPEATTVVYVDGVAYYYYNGTYYILTETEAPRPEQEPDSSVYEGTEDDGDDDEQGPAPQETGEEAEDGSQIVEAPHPPPMIEEEDSRFEVVDPPMGATVPYLPEESKEVVVDEKKYFIYNGVYYRPFASDDDIIYMVVEDPTQPAGDAEPAESAEAQ